MRLICVESEKELREELAAVCSGLEEIDDVMTFPCASDALRWLESSDAAAALLDTDLSDMSGLALAAEIRRIRPDTELIFLSGTADDALAAFGVHASGYLLKPVAREGLAAEVAWAAARRGPGRRSRVLMRTFGNFDLFVDDRPVRFRLAKSKELLAYLVDRQGTSVTRAEAAAILWEDRFYDRSLQKQLDVYIRSLRDTLRENGIPEIFEMERGQLRVDPAYFTCDAYLFFAGDRDAVNAYRGEYMSAYSWASMTESVMFWTQQDG